MPGSKEAFEEELASDVYAFGCVALELLAGQDALTSVPAAITPPSFGVTTGTATAERSASDKVEGDLRLTSAFRSSLKGRWPSLLEGALEPHRAKRANAAELLSALRRQA